MLLQLRNKAKHIVIVFLSLILLSVTPAWAAGPPEPSVFSNPLAIIMIILMIILLIVIAVLANIVIGAADIKAKERINEKGNKPLIKTLAISLLFSLPLSLFAQENTTVITRAADTTIGGLAASTFYILAVVTFLELTVILALLFNIKMLIRKEKEKAAHLTQAEIAEEKKTRLSWWDKFNKLKPVSQEAELDLGHEYDGIRELNNRLPPWWLYGFYLSIIFAGIYLWRYHVSHTAPSSEQEYVRSVEQAELRIAAYLKEKGDAVDENTVTLLTSPEDISAGKIVYTKSCASCHKDNGAGDVGPNLTHDFWLHGNDIKSVFKTVKYGINAMPQWQNTYSNKQIAQVVSYIKSLHGSNPPNPKTPQGIEMKEEPATPISDSTAKDENKIAMN